jgi:TonB family protein
VGAQIDDQLARRVIEEPRRSLFPLIAAIVTGVVVWSVQHAGDDSRQSSAASSSRSRSGAHSNASAGDVRTVFSDDDYPAEALRDGDQGTVQAKLLIDADGRVTACAIIRSSGHQSLDDTTCRILQRRARFLPARDRNGRPIASTFVTPPVTWVIPG